jgi:hypothetical protein
MTRTKSAVLLTVLLGAGLAGCHAGGAPGSAAPSASAAVSRQQLLALGQEWVQCLRGKGITRMPDAQLTEDGYLTFQPQGGYNWKEDVGKHLDVINACKAIEDKYPPNAFRPKQQLSADDLRKLAEYAKCLRAHGLPAWPDPDTDGSFNLEGTSLANGVPKAAMAKATQACSSIWSGKVSVRSGTAGGGKK